MRILKSFGARRHPGLDRRLVNTPAHMMNGAHIRHLWHTATGPIALSVHSCAVGLAHSQDRPKRFEVASVKLSSPDEGGLRISISGNPQAGGRWTSRNATLAQIIHAAYPGHPLAAQLSGGPDWMHTTQFDINARAPNPSTGREELVEMARTLLAERFKLALHVETRETPGYALVLARAGIRHKGLRASTHDCGSVRAATIRGDTVPSASIASCAIRVSQNGPIWRVVSGGIDMKRLAELIGPRVGSPIVDATGLKGQFELTLQFTADPVVAPEPDTVSVFTALWEQLGLRLARRPVPMEVLLVDHVEEPAAD